ncbi:MAG TPA: PH domain-containing protein, partial [Candidatus Paceibacterota bacterium]|nr:PH domain-containing protein [Candidatus Paceibacterota bacterium]
MIVLDKNEHLVLQIRQHWFIFFSQLIVLLFLALLPLIVIEIIKLLPVEIISSGRSILALVIFFYSAWLFILWMVGFVIWTDYYLDIWFVTNTKVINIEQKGLFRREISVLHLDKIQDVTSDVRGMLKTLIDYGNISVHTAGQKLDFVIRNVPQP